MERLNKGQRRRSGSDRIRRIRKGSVPEVSRSVGRQTAAARSRGLEPRVRKGYRSHEGSGVVAVKPLSPRLGCPPDQAASNCRMVTEAGRVGLNAPSGKDTVSSPSR